METLIAAFAGKTNSSKIVLDKLTCKNKLCLANNKVNSCKQMANVLERKHYDTIIIIGQKPLIKNKVCLETQATLNGSALKTNFVLDELINQLNNYNLAYKISTNPGCSYCNNIYYFTISHAKKLNQNCQIILIHIPFLKNFKDIKNFIDILNSMANN